MCEYQSRSLAGLKRYVDFELLADIEVIGNRGRQSHHEHSAPGKRWHKAL